MKDNIHWVIHNLRKYEKIQEKLQKHLDKWQMGGYNIWALENRDLLNRSIAERHIELWKKFLTRRFECVKIIKLSERSWEFGSKLIEKSSWQKADNMI